MGYISLNCDAHVNKEIVDRFADTTALSGSLGYGYRVPRTDENGRQLKALLDYLLDRGAAMGMTEAFLEVRPSNTAAIRLYQSMGFEQVGVRRGYYQATVGREDAAVLKLSLRGRRSRES